MFLKKILFNWFKVIIIAFLLAIGIRTFLCTPIIVDGASMLPTLQDGDKMLVNKLSYTFSEPERFDIIVFHESKEQDFIKRIVGLPGEHIRYKDEILYVNGKPIREYFIEERLSKLKSPSHYTHDFILENLPGGFIKIPEKHVLVLGDNRTNSTDSRILGLISYEQIIGKVLFKYWPLNQLGSVK